MKKTLTHLALFLASLAFFASLAASAQAALIGLTITVSGTSATLSAYVGSVDPGIAVEFGDNTVAGFQNQFAQAVDAKGNFTALLDKLNPNTMYKVMLVRTSDQSPLSKLYTFTTPPVTAVSSITALSSDSATISATVSAGANGVGINYGPSVTSIGNQASMTLNGGTYTGTITGLTPSTTYYYEISGTDGTGTLVSYNKPYQFTTQVAAPTSPATTKTIVDTVGTFGPAPGSPSVASGLVACGDPGQPACNFTYIMVMINTLITYLIFYIVPCIATVIILYAGWLILSSAGNVEKVTKAKGLIFQAVIGIILITVAWLIVKWILITLGYNRTLFPTFY